MLVAVTERCSRKRFGDRDVFVATVGGAKLSDPACDLAVCLALASAVLNRALAPDVLALGEVALSGDIRPVPFLSQRVAEAARLGYRRILVPRGTKSIVSRSLDPSALGEGTRVSEVGHLEDALGLLRHLAAVPG
jgi:DNA repair protein RadA/Sms